MNQLTLTGNRKSFNLTEKAFLANERFIREAGYAPKGKTFSDVNSFALEYARLLPVGQCAAYGQALLNQRISGWQSFPVTPVVTTPITIPSPLGLYSIAKTVAGVITITVPAAIAVTDDGKQQIWFNNQTQANIVSFTGANLLSVGVAKTTITFTAALVGEFARTMSIGGAYICLDIVTTGGGTLA